MYLAIKKCKHSGSERALQKKMDDKRAQQERVSTTHFF